MSRTARAQAVATFSRQGARPAQEDFALAAQDKGIFVVADGFGGPGPGAQAAQAACEAVRGFLVKEAGDKDATLPFVIRSYFSLAGNVLFNALIHANRKVTSLNKGKGVHERGGASVIAGYLDGDLLALASVGGCSAWLSREGRGLELVVPRTYGRLADPFARGRADQSTAAGPDFVDAPLMSVGTAEDLEPEILECRIRPGDWLLLHTDGISDELRAAVTSLQGEALSSSRPATASADALISLLNQAEYEDNSACVLVIF
jgi:serine/threonine protein phosphatase PrpC